MAKKHSIRFLAIVSCLLLLFGTAMKSEAQKPIQWRLSHWFMPSGYVGDGYSWFAKEIEKRTNGRIHVEVYPNGSLGFKNSEALSFVKKGNIEIVSLSAGATSAEEPLIGFSELPFLFPTERAGLYWMKWKYTPVLKPFMEKKWNVKLIGDFRFPPVDIWGKYKITTMEDIKGKKLRCYGGAVEEAMKAVGFKTFSITVSELLPALQQGLVDSMVTTVVSASETKCWEVGIKYRNMPDMVRPMFWVALNLDAFNALSDDLKQIVLDTGRDFTNFMFMEEVKIEEELWNILANNGIEANVIPLETRLQMAEKVKPIWRKVADRSGPEAVEFLKELGKY